MAMSEGVAESLRRLQILADGKTSDDETQRESPADVAKVLGALSLKDVATLAEVGNDGIANKMIDDKTYLMERIVQVASKLPTTSVLSNTLTHKFLEQLWTDMQHPPQSYLGEEYQFRKADGSNNNFLWPHVGAAGQPYARTVKPQRMRPISRPDPGVIFESLLRRKEYKTHPNKISSVLFYVASVIIHDIFNTNHKDFNKSNTSSYLDLAPLYGSDENSQHNVRAMKDGKLKPDCFADPRILGFPPGVGLLLIFFNRFHNDVADKLAQIDENQRFSRILHPPGQDPPADAQQKYDEALFQTARLVTSGLYINIILKDYVRTILNLNRVNSKWNLDPRSEQGKALFGEKIPVATGNQVSAEFNLVYRWHSCVSKRDTEWTERQTASLFPTNDAKDPENPTMDEFLKAIRDWGHSLPQDPFERKFAGLKRNEKTGLFSDDDLASIWTDSVNDLAGAYGANNVPGVLKMVEVLGINQARTWNLASLNEFRKYFKLEPHTTFTSINPDPEVAAQLERLYEHPDNVEIYPGIVVESAKEPKLPGSGLCTNFTTSRAILSDAVALVRGDRFYTVDYTPQNLTNFGFDVASYDNDIDYGCVFYKLVLNALPHNFTKNSIYAHYPLVIPEENKKIMTDLKVFNVYNYDTPKQEPSVAYVESFAACKAVFQNATRTTSLSKITLPSLVVEGRVGKVNHQNDIQILTALRQHLSTKPSKKYIKEFFDKTTTTLMQQYTRDIANVRNVDIIRDVSNLAQVHFAACVFGLPVKTDENPRGAFSARDMWSTLTALYSSIHILNDLAASFRAQQYARGAVTGLGDLLTKTVKSVEPLKNGLFSKVMDMLHDQNSSDLTDQSTHLIQEMLKTGATPEQLVYNYLLPVSATIVVGQARAFADCIEYLLDMGQTHLGNLRELAAKDNEAADTQIEHYVLESLRINSDTSVYVTPSAGVKLNEEGKSVDVQANQTVICNMYAAGHDSTTFKNADEMNLQRDLQSYLPGLPTLQPMFPGQELGRPALVGMLKAIMRLPNVRRAPGPIGTMKSFKSRDGTKLYASVDESKGRLYPSSMKINFG